MQAIRLLIALFLLLSPAFGQTDLFGSSGVNVTPPVVASAIVAGGCSAKAASAINTVTCTVATTTAGQSMIVNFDFFDNHTITLTDTCGGTISLISVSPPFPLVWNGIFEDYTYEITNVSASTNCVVTATDTNTPGSNPWIHAILVGGCTSVCGADVASAVQTTSVNTIPSTPITTSVANELILTFCAISNQGDPIGISNSPQAMTLLFQPSAGILAGSSVAATAGSNFTQCVDTNSFSETAAITTVAVK
jgi:hypothetical protein